MSLVIARGYSFGAGEVVTPTKLNNSSVPTLTADNGDFLCRNTAGTGAVEGVAPATARTLMGLGTAATQNTGAFDAAGAASSAQSAAIAASCQRASNLSDLANASTARTNLGLGTAATQNTGAFDAAGAATAAQSAAIAASCQRASNLSDLASASAARTNLGVLQSNLNSNLAGSIGITQAGSLGGDVIFSTAGAPTVTLTQGTWLVVGSVTARTSDAGSHIWAQFYNNTDSVAFGGGASQEVNAAARIRHNLSASGIITVASGSKVIYFKVFRDASSTLDVGQAASAPAGFIQAVQLTT